MMETLNEKVVVNLLKKSIIRFDLLYLIRIEKEILSNCIFFKLIYIKTKA